MHEVAAVHRLAMAAEGVDLMHVPVSAESPLLLPGHQTRLGGRGGGRELAHLSFTTGINPLACTLSLSPSPTFALSFISYQDKILQLPSSCSLPAPLPRHLPPTELHAVREGRGGVEKEGSQRLQLTGAEGSEGIDRELGICQTQVEMV